MMTMMRDDRLHHSKQNPGHLKPNHKRKATFQQNPAYIRVSHVPKRRQNGTDKKPQKQTWKLSTAQHTHTLPVYPVLKVMGERERTSMCVCVGVGVLSRKLQTLLSNKRRRLARPTITLSLQPRGRPPLSLPLFPAPPSKARIRSHEFSNMTGFGLDGAKGEGGREDEDAEEGISGQKTKRT